MYNSFISSFFRNIFLFLCAFFLLPFLFKLEARNLEVEYRDVIEEYRSECEGPFLCDWGNFCFQHLEEFSQERDDISTDICSQISEYGSFIPSIKGSYCQLIYCPKCNSLVTPGLFYEFEDDFDDDELNFSRTGKCRCSTLWSHELLNLVIALEEEVDEDETDLDILSIENNWQKCAKPAIPSKYFQDKNKLLVSFLEQHLEYMSQNPNCLCYWPHRSKNAQKISDNVYKYSTPLLTTSPVFKNFQVDHYNVSDIEQLFTHTFFYSQYRQSLMLLAQWAESKWTDPNLSIRQHIPPALNSIYRLLDSLQIRFLELYSKCLKYHPHPKIYYERGMVYMHLGESTSALEDIKNVIAYAEKGNQQDLLSSGLYHQEGSAYADLEMYDESLNSLSKAIRQDPNNKDAYFTRAEVYFTLGNFDASLDDYLKSGMHPVFASAKDSQGFHAESLAITDGLTTGMRGSASTYLPNLVASASHIGKGLYQVLWAYGQSPIQASIDLTCAIYQCGEFIASQPILTTVGVIFPEVQELAKTWSKLDRVERIRKTSIIIGKYGTEICLDVIATKGTIAAARVTRNLIKANSLLNLEAIKVNTAAYKIKATEANAKAVIEWEAALKKSTPTQANSTRGWQVGQDIRNLTKEGTIPKWNTVRQRYWKDQAEQLKSNPSSPKYADTVKYCEENVKRMERGLAPQKLNLEKGRFESVELHHIPPQREGGLFDVVEMWPEEHAKTDQFRRLGR